MKIRCICLVLFLTACYLDNGWAQQTGWIVTLSGKQAGYPFITDNPASWSLPYGIAFDSATGNLWITDAGFHAVRKMFPNGTTLSIGNGPGPVSVDGSGTVCRLISPQGVTVDPNTGIVYVTQKDSLIRAISPNLTVTTLAGSVPGYQDGTGTNAKFNDPRGIALNNETGVLYVTDFNNNRVRYVNISTGAVSTLAGSGVAAAADGFGTLASFNGPFGVCFSKAAGNIYVTGSVDTLIRVILPNGNVSTVAGHVASGSTTDGLGTSAKLATPTGCTVDDVTNTLYVVDGATPRIDKVDMTTGNVTTFAAGPQGYSSDGTLTTGGWYSPTSITMGPVSSVLYVADTYNHYIRGIYTTVPPVTSVMNASSISTTSITVTWQPPIIPPTANIFYLMFDNNTGGLNYNLVYTGTGTTYTATGLKTSTSYGFMVMSGNLIGNSSWSSAFTFSTIPAGVPTGLVAPTPTTIYSLSILLGWPYPVDNGANASSYRVEMDAGSGYSTVWTGNTLSALIGSLKAMTYYKFRVYASNSFGESQASLELQVFTGGQFCTMTNAHNFGPTMPDSMAYDPISNSLFIANEGVSYTHSAQVYQIFNDDSGILYGTSSVGQLDGDATTARFAYPNGVATDREGAIYVADRTSCVIRKISDGMVYVIAYFKFIYK
jgi:DNA-binding beta-propeller fold protein YncE